MEQELKTILAEVCGLDEEDFDSEMNFFDEGILDSFGVVHLLVKIEEAFGKKINIAEVVREDLDTLPKLISLIGAA